MAAYQWAPRPRNYDAEIERLRVPTTLVEDGAHPLQPRAAVVVATPTPSADGGAASPAAAAAGAAGAAAAPAAVPADDPLNAAGTTFVDPLSAADDPLGGAASKATTTLDDDPLSASASASSLSSLSSSSSAAASSSSSSSSSSLLLLSSSLSSSRQPARVSAEEEFLASTPHWASKKSKILQRYTTDERIGIQVDFMENAGPQIDKPVDKVKSRLEELDDSKEKEEREMLSLSQQEYVAHIEALQRELRAAWDADMRVKSLKIAIQCAKVLADTEVIKFYPSKFVLVTEILDAFGALVYKRIRDRSVTYDAAGNGKSLPEQFTPAMVSEHARETCRNWFFKIASIRELLPRLLVELAIIRCYSFLTDDPFTAVLTRLSTMCRGIGDPLVASYARAYLLRKGKEVAPRLADYVRASFADDMFTAASARVPRGLQRAEYIDLFSPAVEWLVQCAAHGADEPALFAMLKQHRDRPSSLCLYHMISAFPPAFLAENALSIVELVKASDGVPSSKDSMFAQLAINLVLAAPPAAQRAQIFAEIWKSVGKLDDPRAFMRVAEVLVEYPLHYLTPKDTNAMLGDVARVIARAGVAGELQPQLQSFAQKVVSAYAADFTVLFSMDAFLPFLDFFTGDTRIEVQKAVLDGFGRSKAPTLTSDPVLISTMFEIASSVHDTLSTLSFQDEVRQIGRGICAFVRRVDYGRDVERQLNFYSDCRRAFANLDAVKRTLTLSVCSLASRTYSIMHGRHNKRTAAFARACVAFCFITIPSMENEFDRLHLYSISAQVALFNGAFPQAEAMLKAAITLLQEVPTRETDWTDGSTRPTEEKLVTFVSSFLGILLAVQGSPEHGPLYLAKGLLKVVSEYPWSEYGKTSTGKARVFMQFIHVFCALAQDSLPYHFPGVLGNDVMYAGDEDYERECAEILDQMIAAVLEELAALKEAATSASAQKEVGRLALDFFNTTAAHAALNQKVAGLAANLLSLAKKLNADQAYTDSSLAYMQSRRNEMQA